MNCYGCVSEITTELQLLRQELSNQSRVVAHTEQALHRLSNILAAGLSAINHHLGGCTTCENYPCEKCPTCQAMRGVLQDWESEVAS